MTIMPYIPELLGVFTVFALFVLILLDSGEKRLFYTSLGLSALAVPVCAMALCQNAVLLHGTYRIDAFSQYFKLLLYIGLFLTICLCTKLDGVSGKRKGEFLLLLHTATLAMTFLVSAAHMIPFYLSLELSSYALYTLVVLRRGKNKGIESGLKYFFIGASASAVMLMGFAFLYGAAGSGHFTAMAKAACAGPTPILLLGLVFTLSGAFFKLAVFPFHFWAPDAYEAAPHPAAAFISTVSKVAAIAVILRIASMGTGFGQGFTNVLLVLTVFSLAVGNLAAMGQTDLKRLFAFSSIAHAGYVMIGVASGNVDGFAGAAFYAFALVLMKFTCFFAVVKVSEGGENPSMDDLAAFHKRCPVLAATLMMALFGLAGIPPTVGFTGKLLLFTGALKSGLLWLALFAMANVVVSIYYYLKVLKAAYLLEPAVEKPRIPLTLPESALAVLVLLAMIVIGIWPTPVTDLAFTAAGTLF